MQPVASGCNGKLTQLPLPAALPPTMTSHCHVQQRQAEERINYERRMGDKWVADLAALKTNWEKEYLSRAPVILVAFKKT